MTEEQNVFLKPPAPVEITGAEMQAIRKKLGLSTALLGRAFGYVGTAISVSGTIRKYESGQRPIPPWLARLMVMYSKYGVPRDFLDGYNYPDTAKGPFDETDTTD